MAQPVKSLRCFRCHQSRSLAMSTGLGGWDVEFGEFVWGRFFLWGGGGAKRSIYRNRSLLGAFSVCVLTPNGFSPLLVFLESKRCFGSEQR